MSPALITDRESDRGRNKLPAPIELKKRLDEVRLMESRKSARLADVDTDFARLADMAGDRRRASATIELLVD
ncbi:putative Papillomavirus regulatory factor prf-1 [Operophtera brumata]|uniref:Putative Papillomavirus regulatory factor prf-1 n=1 Tax=Operophtera brumata TaxID=104452 RepID=A0A0L7LUW2_OPEBR|nr:putative Papillomavirus regulatory factor prf-1 [Operophtera brumata]